MEEGEPNPKSRRRISVSKVQSLLRRARSLPKKSFVAYDSLSRHFTLSFLPLPLQINYTHLLVLVLQYGTNAAAAFTSPRRHERENLYLERCGRSIASDFPLPWGLEQHGMP